MEHNIPTLDFEKLAALSDDERSAAIAEYNAAVEASVRGGIEAQYDSELKNARYESAKYKLALDKELPNFGERLGAIEEILASNEMFLAMGDEEKLRTAYYIDRGKNVPAPKSADALIAELESNPEAMRAVEAAVIERLRREKSPALSAGSGNASVPLTPKAKPKTLGEASALAREAFGI